MKNTEVVWSCLKEAQLTVKPSNCKFAKDQEKFLGHVSGKRSPSKTKIQAIKGFSFSTTKIQIYSYLRTMDYCARGIKNTSG